MSWDHGTRAGKPRDLVQVRVSLPLLELPIFFPQDSWGSRTASRLKLGTRHKIFTLVDPSSICVNGYLKTPFPALKTLKG